MTTKLKQLTEASDTATGRFAHIHNYIATSGILSIIVELRVGCTYNYQLEQAIVRADMINEQAMSEKYGIDIVEVQQAIKKQVDSWNKSLRREHKPKTDYSTTLGTTKRGIAVVKSGKDNASIKVCGYKLYARYDENTLSKSKEVDGLKRFTKHLQSFVAYRPYTLSPFTAINKPTEGIGPVQYGPNFEKVSIQGLTLYPSDVFSMLEELRSVA